MRMKLKNSYLLCFFLLLVGQSYAQKLLDDKHSSYFYYDFKNIVNGDVSDYFDITNSKLQEMLKQLNSINEQDSTTTYSVLYFRYNLTTAHNSLAYVPITNTSTTKADNISDETLRNFYRDAVANYLYGGQTGDWQNKAIQNENVRAAQNKIRAYYGLNVDLTGMPKGNIHYENTHNRLPIKANSVLLVLEDAVLLSGAPNSEDPTAHGTAELICRAYISSPDADLQAKLNQQMQLRTYDPNDRVGFLNKMLSYLQSRTVRVATKQTSMLLFVGGYELGTLPSKNKAEAPSAASSLNYSDGEDYWVGDGENIAVKFRERIRPEIVYYASGNKTALTAKFGLGFTHRYNKGKKAGKDLWEKIKKQQDGLTIQLDGESKINTKIHIVAHSMGYAYALGMLDELRQHVNTQTVQPTFGSFYIIAPENASEGKNNLADFEEVYQYGSKENSNDGTSADVYLKRDGVAPQEPIQGFEKPNRELPQNQGRAYYPREEDAKGNDTGKDKPDYPRGKFDSHSIKHYGWIFDDREISKSKRGYVKQK